MIDESRAPALLIAAYFFTISAWIVSNPPGAAPDEAAHYIRAAAASAGDILPDNKPEEFPGETKTKSIRWMLQQARLASLPGRLSPVTFRCRGIPGRIAPCEEKAPVAGTVEELTYVGTYPPTPYLAPAIFMKGASGTTDALYLGRTGSALVCWVLLGLAIAVAWDKRAGWVSLLGVSVAISPMVIYMAASLSGSGIETAAAICFSACLLRLTRKPALTVQDANGSHPSWIWGAAGLSGALLASSRDLGIIWLGVHFAIFILWMGARASWATLRSGRRAAAVAGAAVSASVVFSLAWQFTVQVRPPFSFRDWLAQMRPSFGFFFSTVRQQIGIFGPLDTVMPVIAYAGWIAITLSLFVVAVYAADRRRRLLAFGTAFTTAAMALALDALQRTVGFGVQGRYLLPLAVAVPIISGEIVVQTRQDVGWLRHRLWHLTATGVISGVLLLGWYTIGRRYSVGLRGPIFFVESSEWSPPFGWLFWGSIAAVGAFCMLMSALASVPDTRAHDG